MKEKNNFMPAIDDLGKFFGDERPKVVKYLLAQYGKYGFDQDDADDCFQEGCMAVWRNIQDGKLTEENLTCSLSTYLTTCCRNHATHSLKKMVSIETFEGIIDEEGNLTRDVPAEPDDTPKEEIVEILIEVVADLPEPCDKVLWGFYRDNLSMDAMAQMLGYSNADTMKTTKSRCMKKLKERMLNILKDM